MSRFTLPRDIYHGEGSLEVLKSIRGERAIVVVGGSSMQKFGFLDEVVYYLKEANMEVEIFEGVEPDPSVETVMEGAEVMRKFNPDWIVSIGGGSPIDAAKAMWIFYENKDFTFEEAVIPFGLPELRKKARFIAIPSTSGTATEVTAFSVITDYKAKIKYPIADFNITPDIAIIDPKLAQTMPKELTAHTGMDALTHAIEAYTAALKSNFSDPLALKAIEMVNENLVASYNEDKEARNLMHEAQCLAGMAFSNALLGIVHSMAHKTGAVFNIPHGCANAIYLPYVIEYNKTKCLDRYAEIARRLNLEGSNDEELTASLVKYIKDMNVKLNIPLTLKDFGVEEDYFKANVDFVSKNAILDACTGSNPREIDAETMKRLFVCVYYGIDVDF